MAMEITNNYNGYATNYAAANGKRQVAENKKTGAAGETALTRDKAADYYSSLQKKYECVRDGKVSISGAYLKECAKDPEKAKQMESDLAFYKESYENGRKNAEAYLNSLGDKLVSYDETWSYDDKGNLTMTVYVQGTTESGAKDWKELKKEQEKKLKEKREKDRIEEKKKAEKAERKKAAEKLQEARKAKSSKVREETPPEALSKAKAGDFDRPSLDVRV